MRGVAILVVLGFHYNFPPLGGGFLGVDLFFVLSGFLITSKISHSLSSASFSLSDFWKRRVLRLSPANLLLVLFIIFWNQRLNSQQDLKTPVQNSVRSTLLYSANWFFIEDSQYFGLTYYVNPLLHMWSLALEEQFYFVWPIFLVLVHRFVSRKLFVPILVIQVISIVINLWVGTKKDEDPQTAYMGTHSKIFEPILGGLAAVIISERPRIKEVLFNRFSSSIATIGLLVCLGTLWTAIEVEGVYQGSQASGFYYEGGGLLFSICSFVVIGYVSETDNRVVRLLGNRVLSWLGVISYSIYLWHYPLITFMSREQFLEIPRLTTTQYQLVIVSASILIGFVSYRFVEKPFLNPRRAKSLNRYLVFAVLAIVLLILKSLNQSCFFCPQELPNEPAEVDPLLHSLNKRLDQVAEKYLQLESRM